MTLPAAWGLHLPPPVADSSRERSLGEQLEQAVAEPAPPTMLWCPRAVAAQVGDLLSGRISEAVAAAAAATDHDDA